MRSGRFMFKLFVDGHGHKILQQRLGCECFPFFVLSSSMLISVLIVVVSTEQPCLPEEGGRPQSDRGRGSSPWDELFHRGDHDGALEAFSAADRAEPGQAQCVGARRVLAPLSLVQQVFF